MKRKFDNNIIESKRDSINAAISLYPKQSKHILYGTAGFRDDVSVPLQPVFLRVGILAAIRSLHKSSEIVGVMITASHNPEQDNGVKMIDNDGGMLDQQWEKYAEELANAPEADFFNVLQSALDSLELNSIKNNVAPVVFIGRDTRPHSLMLSRCVQQGIESVGGITVDLEEVTTPQLHYIVGTCNINEITVTAKILPDINKLKELYLQNFASSYLKLIENTEPNSSDVKLHDLVVDASNGVGSITLMELLLIIDSASTYKSGRRDYSAVDVRNAARCGLVNDDCGAEHVQKGVRPPLGVNAAKDFGKLLCSFDGDADRIVFHSFLSADGPWVLMDGDKIAALFTVFLQGEMKHLSAGDDDLAPNINRLRFGVVQTAYANGSSTKFFKDRNILVSMAKTGVKYLHRKAHEDFDIGVYFEANGHGTILFSDAFLKVINHAVNNMEQYESRKQLAIQRLHVSLVCYYCKVHYIYSLTHSTKSAACRHINM